MFECGSVEFKSGPKDKKSQEIKTNIERCEKWMSFRSWIRWCQIRHHCNRDPFFRFNILTFMFTSFISFGLMLLLKSFVLILLVLFLGLVYLFHLSVWFYSWIVLFWYFVLFWISFIFYIFRLDVRSLVVLSRKLLRCSATRIMLLTFCIRLMFCFDLFLFLILFCFWFSKNKTQL